MEVGRQALVRNAPLCPEDLQELEADIAGALEPWPSISSKLRVSSYGTDSATQTDASDIVELKELTDATQGLSVSVDLLKKDLVFQKTVLQADHEERLQEQARRLYSKMNDTLRNLEVVHQEKLEMARRSFQQQLADALAVMKVKYEKYYLGDGDPLSDTKEDLTAKIKQLVHKLQIKQSKIESLEAQLLEYEESEPAKQIIYETEEDPEKEQTLEQNKGLREEIDVLKNTIAELEDNLEIKEKENQSLVAEAKQMKEKMDKGLGAIDKLAADLEAAKDELEKEKASSAAVLQKQKDDMEKVMNEKIKVNEEELRAQKEIEARKKLAAEKEKEMLQLERHQLLLLQQQQKEQLQQSFTRDNEARISEQQKMAAQLQKLQKTIEVQRKTINSLRNQLEQNNKIWEKKFAILKQSLHAIKDEMFLRQSLQRQAASLQRVSVSYAVEGPLGPSNPHGHMDAARNCFPFPVLPLPGIGSQSVPQEERVVDIRPVSQGYNFNADELQVVSDNEEDMGAAPLLPSPPTSRRQTPVTPHHQVTQA
ncbi:hypothetical protein NDU88_008171 [Pleurodeles waltl]|uniref:DUF4709 domain-containing protein n=1 Tax=Pleurodeles waltl TaxID=8319 RepID=A0AAV7NDG0_PLEWA|nr:hypothetical protein NDU88_008171 [Pleurodeles waltl]